MTHLVRLAVPCVTFSLSSVTSCADFSSFSAASLRADSTFAAVVSVELEGRARRKRDRTRDDNRVTDARESNHPRMRSIHRADSPRAEGAAACEAERACREAGAPAALAILPHEMAPSTVELSSAFAEHKPSIDFGE